MNDCEKYIDRQNDLRELFSKFKEDINSITNDSVKELCCLLCKSAYDRVGGELIAFFKDLTKGCGGHFQRRLHGACGYKEYITLITPTAGSKTIRRHFSFGENFFYYC